MPVTSSASKSERERDEVGSDVEFDFGTTKDPELSRSAEEVEEVLDERTNGKGTTKGRLAGCWRSSLKREPNLESVERGEGTAKKAKAGRKHTQNSNILCFKT